MAVKDIFVHALGTQCFVAIVKFCLLNNLTYIITYLLTVYLCLCVYVYVSV